MLAHPTPGSSVQAQLDETHKLLHEEHKKRFKLEDDNTRLKLELQRVQVQLAGRNRCAALL